MGKIKKPIETGTNEQKVIPDLDPEGTHFVFKSKFKEDQVTLNKPKRESLSDGSTHITPADVASFGAFTWATDDADLARRLRDIIARRLKLGSPLHILETTDVKE